MTLCLFITKIILFMYETEKKHLTESRLELLRLVTELQFEIKHRPELP